MQIVCRLSALAYITSKVFGRPHSYTTTVEHILFVYKHSAKRNHHLLKSQTTYKTVEMTTECIICGMMPTLDTKRRCECRRNTNICLFCLIRGTQEGDVSTCFYLFIYLLYLELWQLVWDLRLTLIQNIHVMTLTLTCYDVNVDTKIFML